MLVSIIRNFMNKIQFSYLLMVMKVSSCIAWHVSLLRGKYFFLTRTENCFRRMVFKDCLECIFVLILDVTLH